MHRSRRDTYAQRDESKYDHGSWRGSATPMHRSRRDTYALRIKGIICDQLRQSGATPMRPQQARHLRAANDMRLFTRRSCSDGAAQHLCDRSRRDTYAQRGKQKQCNTHAPAAAATPTRCKANATNMSSGHGKAVQHLCDRGRRDTYALQKCAMAKQCGLHATATCAASAHGVKATQTSIPDFHPTQFILQASGLNFMHGCSDTPRY